MSRTAAAKPGIVDLKALQGQVKILVQDLRQQVPANPALVASLKEECAGARAAGRVGASYETWLEDVLDQAAVAWVLGCVFVRFCEDNELIDKLWIGGEDDAAPMERAVQNRQAFIIADPVKRNDRHWLRDAFGYLAELRPTGKLFDQHSPVWRFDISGEAAEALSDFFRKGAGARSLRTKGLDTWFLGDLYQYLSQHARDTYALLQTPEFIVEFILDRTLEPSIDEFGLPNTSTIDPTCGSGHFLLATFRRLVRKWHDRDPDMSMDDVVERALSQVTGVDINPFAVAIARFRLMVAALKVAGVPKLERAPRMFRLRVATGDSLLEWGKKSRHQGDMVAMSEGRPAFAYATEDADMLAKLLDERYTAVMGNPPYITVKDKALNETYRELYPKVCYRLYQLTAPFAKRFFDLAKGADENGDLAGRVGQITANGFMKREFGKRLIEKYFAHDIELTEVIDTSGAFIPGHGTPTVILVGRKNNRRRSERVRAVLGVRGEPGQPDNPADGQVWTAILAQVDQPGSESAWVTVADLARNRLDGHPWSLSGGGADQIIVQMNTSSPRPLKAQITEVGFGAVTREDDAYMLSRGPLRRHGVPDRFQRLIVEGDVTRDWSITTPTVSVWPYDEETLKPQADVAVCRLLWPLRRPLSERVAYGNTQLERGLEWFEYSMFFGRRFRNPLSIAFAFVATHNHFILDRGGKVFNRSAPIVKLPQDASVDEHLKLLGVLNSSIACFWLKQVSHDKGSQGVNEGFKSQEWERFYEFTGTKLEQFPLPEQYPLELSRQIDQLAQRLAVSTPAAVAASGIPTKERLATARIEYESVRSQMIALQEELDWAVYNLYGLTDGAITSKEPPELRLGERTFEIVLARKLAAGEVETQWFARHSSTPNTELPDHWSDEYRSIVEHRMATIESDRNIALIERPEYKRRWSTEGWDAMQQTALRDWLLDRLESPELWGGAPTPLSVAQIADRLRHNDEFRSVLDLWAGTSEHHLTKTLSKLLGDEHVPYLPSNRYRPDGLRKRAEWERTWRLQRREDAEDVKLDIPLPPKYKPADFAKPSYWRARGKLDVPKERFISYPGMGRDGDGTELLGWAGWDHLAQAQALATVYLDRKQNAGWPPERLLPLLAGIVELEPWLHQWYADSRPGFPGSPSAFFSGLIDTELAALSADREALRTLRGVEDLD